MEKVTIAGKGPKMLKLSDERFVGVSRPVTLDHFERGGTYTVDIEQNGKFFNITKVHDVSIPAPVAAPKEKDAPVAATGSSYKSRDFDAEARGKTRCAMYEAALQSPVVANLVLTVNGLEKALEVVKQAADAGFDYVFPQEEK